MQCCAGTDRIADRVDALVRRPIGNNCDGELRDCRRDRAFQNEIRETRIAEVLVCNGNGNRRGFRVGLAKHMIVRDCLHVGARSAATRGCNREAGR